MSLPGWYPDPAGAPGRYRYWTGSQWSNETTGDPNTAPPTASPTGSPNQQDTQSRPDRTRRSGLTIVALAVVLVLVVVISVVLIRTLGGDQQTTEPAPTSTVSGWDDSSPLPTASPSPTPSATPSPTPSPTPSRRTPTPTPSSAAPPPPMETCPTGEPDARTQHPNDGRLHGGELSLGAPKDWEDGGGYLDGLSWAYDVAGAIEQTEPHWFAIVAAGSLRIADGFTDPRVAAHGVMDCIATSGYYHYVTGRKNISANAVTVDGKPGWRVRSEVRVDDGISVPGDLVEVIVVDGGAGESLSMFVGAVPIGDSARIRLLDATVAGLRVD